MRSLHPFVLAVSLFVSGVASAQGTPSSSDQEARLQFQAGQLAFQNGEYERALESFERAYALSHRAALLYNIGVTAERLRRDDRALEAFRGYLAEVPTGEFRGQVESRIRILEESLAARQAEEARLEAERAAQAQAASEGETTPTTAEEPASGLGFFIGAGGAAALAIGGGIYWANRGSELDSCRGGVGGTLLCGNESTLKRQRNAAVSITIIGAIAAPSLVAAAIIQRRHSRRGADTEPTVACAPGLLGAACVGTF